jgi:TMEM117 protein family
MRFRFERESRSCFLTCESVRSVVNALRRIYGHPYLRILCASALVALTLIMFLEDPQSYSNVDLDLPFLGVSINFLFAGYPSSDLNFRWLMLKIWLVVAFPLIGIILGEMLFRRMLLQRFLNLRGFKNNKGCLLCGLAASVCFLWLAATCYNLAVSRNDHHALSFLQTLSKYDFKSDRTTSREGPSGETDAVTEANSPPDKNGDGWCDDYGPTLYNKNSENWKKTEADLKRTEATSVLPIPNSIFMIVAFYLSFLGAGYTWFAVLDAVLQDRETYPTCCPRIKRGFWPFLRIPLFWMCAIVCILGVALHANYVVANGGGYLYWQGEFVSSPNASLKTDGPFLNMKCASLDNNVNSNGEVSTDERFCYWGSTPPLGCNATAISCEDWGSNGKVWFGNHFLIETNKIREQTERLTPEGPPCNHSFSFPASQLPYDEWLLGSVRKRVSPNKMENPRVERRLFEEDFRKKMNRENGCSEWEPALSVDRSDEMIKDKMSTLSGRGVFSSRGYWGMSEYGRIWLAAIILMINIIIVSQDVSYPHYDCEDQFYKQALGANRPHSQAERELEFNKPPLILKIPGLPGDRINLPSSFRDLKRNVRRILRCVLVDECAFCARSYGGGCNLEERYYANPCKKGCNRLFGCIKRCRDAEKENESPKRGKILGIGNQKDGREEEEEVELDNDSSDISLTSDDEMSWEANLYSLSTSSVDLDSSSSSSHSETDKKRETLISSTNSPLSKKKSKREKPKKEFVTTRWLVYAVIIFVFSLDAINLYSQANYTPEAYGQIADREGYVYPAVETGKRENFLSELPAEDQFYFKYDSLQLMCPYSLNEECLTNACFRRRRDDFTVPSPLEYNRNFRPTEVLEENWLEEELDLLGPNWSFAYSVQFASTDVSRDEYLSRLEEIIPDARLVLNSAFEVAEGTENWNINAIEENELLNVHRERVNVSSSVDLENGGISSMALNTSFLWSRPRNFENILWEKVLTISTNGQSFDVNSTFSSRPGDVHFAWGKKCVCYKVQALLFRGLMEDNDGTGDGFRTNVDSIKWLSDKRKYSTSSEGTHPLLDSCYYGEDAKGVGEIPFLMSDAKLEASCNKMLLYKLKLDHREYVDLISSAVRVGRASVNESFQPANIENVTGKSSERTVLDWMNSLVWFYKSFDPGVQPNLDVDARCMGCLSQPLVDGGSSFLKNAGSNLQRGRIPNYNLRYSGVLSFQRNVSTVSGERGPRFYLGVYFDNKCHNLEESFYDQPNLTASSEGRSEEGKLNKLPTLDVAEYSCILTVGPLNVKYVGTSEKQKLMVCLVPFFFALLTICRITADYVYRSLLKFKVKHKRNKEAATFGALGLEMEKKEIREQLWHNKDKDWVSKHGKCKKRLLNFCLALHCEKRYKTKKIKESAL